MGHARAAHRAPPLPLRLSCCWLTGWLSLCVCGRHPVDRKVGSFRYQGDDCTTPVRAYRQTEAVAGRQAGVQPFSSKPGVQLSWMDGRRAAAPPQPARGSGSRLTLGRSAAVVGGWWVQVEASTGSQRPAKKPNEGTPTLKAFFQAKQQQPDTSSPHTKQHAVKKELPSSPPPGPASPFAPRRGGLGAVMKKEEEEEEAVNTDESVDQEGGRGVKHKARESLLLQALEKRSAGRRQAAAAGPWRNACMGHVAEQPVKQQQEVPTLSALLACLPAL